VEIIKRLRRKNGINQSDLAAAIGVSLRTIQLYEKRNANIPIKNLNKIADFFKMSIGELFLYEVNETGESYSKEQPFVTSGSIGYSLGHGKTLLKVPLVPAEAQKEFVESYAEGNSLKKAFRMDFLVRTLENTTYVAFEVTGDAMDNGTSFSVPNGAVVLAKKVDKSKLHINDSVTHTAFVLVCADRIICKAITRMTQDKKGLICHNLNPSPEFRDFEVAMDEVYDVYEVIKKQVNG